MNRLRFTRLGSWRSVWGTALCATGAALLSILFLGSGFTRVLPLAFLGIIVLIAVWFGALAGVLGSLAAAAIFAASCSRPLAVCLSRV
jgi:hypothetical protein